MSDFPMDVVADILSRLPVKPLLRFRCVSKPWCALIDSSHFIQLHLNRSIQTNANLSIIVEDYHLYFIDLDSLDRAIKLDHPLKFRGCVGEVVGPTIVFGSCNGLLCLCNTEDQIVLLNPSTRKHHRLPVAPIEFPRVFNICQFMIYGFGYDSVNDDYKLVRIVQFYGESDDSFASQVKVYSLKSNSWRRIQDFPYSLRHKRANGVVVSGALHWVVSPRPESDIANLIAAIDLGVEEYRLVPQPDYLHKDFHMDVGVLGGCLCVSCNYGGHRADIWVMKEYGVKESWTKLFSIEQPRGLKLFVRPLAYSKSGGEVLVNQDNEKLLWFDLRRKTVKKVRIRKLLNLYESEICLESLVPLRDDGGSDGKKQQAQKKKDKKGRDDFLSTGFKLVP